LFDNPDTHDRGEVAIVIDGLTTPCEPMSEGWQMNTFTVPVFGPLAWIDVILLVWFAMAAVSVAYIAWDVFTNTPENTVITWA